MRCVCVRTKTNPEDLISGVNRASSGWKWASSEAGLQCCFFVSSKSQAGPCCWVLVCGVRFLGCVGWKFWLVLELLGYNTNALCVCGAFNLRKAVRLHSLFHLTCACPAQALPASCPLPALLPVPMWNSLAVYIDLSSLCRFHR